MAKNNPHFHEEVRVKNYDSFYKSRVDLLVFRQISGRNVSKWGIVNTTRPYCSTEEPILADYFSIGAGIYRMTYIWSKTAFVPKCVEII
jgi:hypothetical protein